MKYREWVHRRKRLYYKPPLNFGFHLSPFKEGVQELEFNKGRLDITD